MSKRLDAVTGRKYTNRNGEEKTAWTRIGTLLVNDEGRMSLKLDALPLANDKGEVWVSFFEPKARDNAPAPQQSYGGGGGMDDEIPFAPEWRG